jgi:ubiquinone/menaquinone biosynthesis C-methylase UbiE
MQSPDYYNEIGTYYDQDAQDYDLRYWANPVLQRIRQSFRETVKRYPASAMLEIGYGTGLDLVHFARTHPDRFIYGIDISAEMFRLAGEKIEQHHCRNIAIRKGSVEDIPVLFPSVKFDIIYIFFGALNTTQNIDRAARILTESLNPEGILVISFVNKWYLTGMALELIKFKWEKAFARLKPIWGGYSPGHYLASFCYSPEKIRSAFSGLTVLKRKGFCIVHPAWYFTRINQKIGRLGNILWTIDQGLDKTFMWRFGEYALIVFKK